MPSPPNAMRAPPAVSAPVTNTSCRVAQRTSVPPAARNRHGGIFGADRLAIGEIDVAVAGEGGMQHDVHEPAQTFDSHFGHAGDRFRIELAGSNHAQLPARSVTSIVSSATNARLHGRAKPRTTTVTSMFWPSAVS